MSEERSQLTDHTTELETAQVGIIMGSDSDLRVMQAAADMLGQLDVPFEMTIVSAHRTPAVSYTHLTLPTICSV